MRHILASDFLCPKGRRLSESKFFESCRKATSNFSVSLLTDPRRVFSIRRVDKYLWQTLRRAWSRKAPGARGQADFFLKGLILAQNERCRRGLGMQVEREPLGN